MFKILVFRENLECGKTFVQKTRKANHNQSSTKKMKVKKCKQSNDASSRAVQKNTPIPD